MEKGIRYAYVFTQEEFIYNIENVEKYFDIIYLPSHPLSRRMKMNKNDKYFVAFSEESYPESFIGVVGTIYFETDNPILDAPQLGQVYLTHYILSKEDDAILGKVFYSQGEYFGIKDEQEQEVFRTTGQTSFKTLEEIMELEKKSSFSEFYLCPLQIVWLPQ